MTQRDDKGQFTKGATGNPRGRPVGTSINQKIRKSIAEDGGRLLDAIKQAAFNGDMAAAKILIDRLSPSLKPESDRIQLPALAQDDIGKQAQAIIEGAACGDLAPDVAATLVSAITGKARITELAEIEARIAALEDKSHD